MVKALPEGAPAAGRVDPRERIITASMEGFFDPEWYCGRYPDVAAADIDPLLHFIRHGAAESRDPNRFFNSYWYVEHYRDVAASGMHPLLHYLQSGAAELRNPHPRFDAVYYVDRHPEAAANPLLYHLSIGAASGFLTERPVEIMDYLPSPRRASPLPRDVLVDVVIPVYRGLEETRRCLNSVFAHTRRPLGRIIVIEDASPEPELVAWLRQLAAVRRIELIRNRRNLGFARSVNRGMAAAGEHDVVLLNSDTEVPLDWLRRLTAGAYAQDRVATVSPFSNNATICGYPDNAGGPLAFGQTVGQIDDACRAVNAGRSVSLPTTVGFCMYVRREALREVGNLDAERFSSGYGEENDFCLRATALGWRHQLACDIFVFHRGSVSFGHRTKQLTARATKLLHERYPEYARTVAQYVELGAVAPFRFAVTAALFRRSNLPVILMVSHDLGGGVGRHIDTLARRYRDTARILLLEGTDRGATLSIPGLPGHPVLTLPAERIGDLVVLLQSMGVSRVHVHHLVGVDIDIHELIHRLGVPFDVTVHDYYGICPQTNMLPWPDGFYCGEPGIASCNACIAARPSHGARDILSWRADHQWLFTEADRVLCPSEDTLSRLRRQRLGNKALLAPHEPVTAETWPLHRPNPAGVMLRIAVLGVLADHKGARTVASVAETVDPKTMEIHLIGHAEGNFPPPALRRIKVTGQYTEADLQQLIETASPHIIWFPTPWPETFSFTLSAAIASGLPIVATRIGAFVERLRGRPLTWLAEVTTSPAAWIKLFEEIRQTLGKATMTDPPPARAASDDFYDGRYLAPATLGRSAASGRSRGSRAGAVCAVVPERFEVGFPTPCAYIRLLEPLDHPGIAGSLDVRVTDVRAMCRCEADIIVTQRHAIPDLATAELTRLSCPANRGDVALRPRR